MPESIAMTRRLLTGLNVATLAVPGPAYGLIDDGAILVEDGMIKWVGELNDAPDADQTEDFGGRLATPALIDCHTHLVYGGNRASEFEMRLEGASYADVAKAGGGIAATVRATRETTNETLLAETLVRVDAMLAEGVGVIEVKSGYGLDAGTELEMLRVARRIASLRSVEIRTSFLGAHAVAADFGGGADAYIDEVCIPALRGAHAEGLVDAVDAFCEGIAFNTKQIGRVFDVAKSLGLPVKLHAEQLSNTGGTQLAAKYGALSADHLEYASQADAQALAGSASVAVLLPGAFYTLRESQLPPVDAFRAHGVPMALATDCNPGSSPMTSLLLAMNMGCTLFRLTAAEALAAVTRNAAKALAMPDVGVIALGMRANLAIWDIEQPAELSYRIGTNRLHRRMHWGEF